MAIDPAALSALAPPIFASLDEEDTRAVASRLASMSFAAGESVFSRHDPVTGLFIVASGRLRISISSAEGREIAFRVAGPGETIGEIAALDGGARSADATAIEAARAFVLMRRDLDLLLEQRPALARCVIGFLCRRLRDTSDQLESLALLNIEQRLARFLLTLEKHGGKRVGRRGEIDLDVSQTDLGFLLGASRPKVNVALGALEAEGLIARRGRRIVFDVDVLTERAGVDPP